MDENFCGAVLAYWRIERRKKRAIGSFERWREVERLRGRKKDR